MDSQIVGQRKGKYVFDIFRSLSSQLWEKPAASDGEEVVTRAAGQAPSGTYTSENEHQRTWPWSHGQFLVLMFWLLARVFPFIWMNGRYARNTGQHKDFSPNFINYSLTHRSFLSVSFCGGQRIKWNWRSLCLVANRHYNEMSRHIREMTKIKELTGGSFIVLWRCDQDTDNTSFLFHFLGNPALTRHANRFPKKIKWNDNCPCQFSFSFFFVLARSLSSFFLILFTLSWPGQKTKRKIENWIQLTDCAYSREAVTIEWCVRTMWAGALAPVIFWHHPQTLIKEKGIKGTYVWGWQARR